MSYRSSGMFLLATCPWWASAPLAEEVDLYEDIMYRRLLVKPGITGLWQVSGRSDLSWDESVRLDLYYVKTGL